MLKMIYRLKSGMFPALFFLTSASVLAQPLVIPPGHWQEGMAVGVTEFSGTLYVRDVSWQWQPRSVRMSSPDAVQAGLAAGKGGMVSESRTGQDNITAGQGWSVVSGEVTPEAEKQVKRQLWQVNGYEWTPDYAGLTVRPDAFISGAESLLSQENGRQHIAGAWVTSLSDVRVNFPGAEEPVKRWQGNLTPVVVYFWWPGNEKC